MSYLILLHLFMFHSLKMQRRPAVLPNVYVKLQFVIEWPEGTATNHEQWTEITAQATWKNTQAVNQIVYECLFLGTNFSSILTTMKQPHDTIISKDGNFNSYMRLKFHWPVYFLYISIHEQRKFWYSLTFVKQYPYDLWLSQITFYY